MEATKMLYIPLERWFYRASAYFVALASIHKLWRNRQFNIKVFILQKHELGKNNRHALTS